MDPNLRNLKDFLGLYNKVTELCFTRCVDNLNDRNLSKDEGVCVDHCVTKFARFNQQMMSVYVEVQTDINQRRLKELEDNQKELERQQQEEKQKQQAKENSANKPSILTPSPPSTVPNSEGLPM